MIIKDHHKPIISRELFEKANRMLDAKSLSQEGKAKYSNRYPFSGKIKCGKCGASYVARYKTRKDGSKYKAWRCYQAANHGSPHIDKAGNQVGCFGTSIRNEEAIHIMCLVCRQLKINRQKIVQNLIHTINKVVLMDRSGADITVLAEKMEMAKQKRTRLIDLYTSGDIDRNEFNVLRAKYDVEINNLEARMERIGTQQGIEDKQNEWMENVKYVMEELIGGVEYEDEFYKQILDRIVVMDKEHIEVYLKFLSFKWSYTVAETEK